MISNLCNDTQPGQPGDTNPETMPLPADPFDTNLILGATNCIMIVVDQLYGGRLKPETKVAALKQAASLAETKLQMQFQNGMQRGLMGQIFGPKK